MTYFECGFLLKNIFTKIYIVWLHCITRKYALAIHKEFCNYFNIPFDLKQHRRSQSQLNEDETNDDVSDLLKYNTNDKDEPNSLYPKEISEPKRVENFKISEISEKK